MCDSCLAEALHYGEVLPDWYLERATKDGVYFKAGWWGLVWMNEPSFVFTVTPEVTPRECENEDDPDYEALNDALSDWLDKFESSVVCLREQMHDSLPFLDYYRLVQAGINKGYDPENHGSFQLWLVNHVAQYIAANPEPRKTEPDDSGM